MNPSIPSRVTMIVTCVDGTKHKFEFAPQSDLTNQAGRIERMLDAPNIVLELADRMMVIPVTSIRPSRPSSPTARCAMCG